MVEKMVDVKAFWKVVHLVWKRVGGMAVQ